MSLNSDAFVGTMLDSLCSKMKILLICIIIGFMKTEYTTQTEDWHTETTQVPTNTEATERNTTDIRLVNGRYPWQGRVEVLFNNTWGTICDDSFDRIDAQVICSMLGYDRNGNIYAYSGAAFGEGNGSIMLDDLHCNGKETDISECPSNGWFTNNCLHSEDAGVSCKATGRNTTDIRLVNGRFPWEGRVEVFHNNQWGTICDDSFDTKEAQVICYMLGYDRNGHIKAYGVAAFGQGNGPIMLDDLSCNGNETNISECPSIVWFRNDCHHNEDAGVSCGEGVTTEETTTYGYDETTHVLGNQGHIPIRLTNGNHGILEVYHNGRWGTVCYSYQNYDSVCRELGYGSVGRVTSQYSSSYAILDHLSCPSWYYYTGLDSCTGRFTNTYCTSKLYIRCEESTTVDSTSTDTPATTDDYSTHALGYQGHIPIRLPYGSGGLLEVYHNGRWGAVCYNYQSREHFDSVCEYHGYSYAAQVAPKNSSAYAILDQLTCPSQSRYYHDGLDSCTGRFTTRYCRNKLYIRCEFSMTTESTATLSSGCQSVLPADVIFVVDESGSVGTDNFDKTRHSIIDTIRHLQVRNDFIRIGVMTFDDSSRTVFNLNSYPGNENTMERQVSSMPYSSGSTDIANALKRACNTMLTSTNGDRLSAQNYLVLLTDGQSDANAAQTAAAACKASGTRIISVGIGDSIDENMLRNVAYNTNYYIRTNYSDIATFLPTLVTTAVNCGGLENTDARYVSVNCQESNWYIKVRLPPLEHKYADFKDSDIYLGSDSCTGYRSGDYLIFNEEYTTCKTNKTTSRDSVIYSNTLVYSVHDPVHHFIVREYRFKVYVECDMSKTENGHNNINQNHGQRDQQTVAGTGHFAVELKFYSDSKYQHEFSGFPPSYMIGDNVYVKVQTHIHDYDVKMRLSDCFTKPTESSADVYLYYLIKNGCPVDPDAAITLQSTHETRFHFQDFEYANHPDAMYVHCNATFCQINDYSRTCEPQCSHRKRKGNSKNIGPTGYNNSGPIGHDNIGSIGYAEVDTVIHFLQEGPKQLQTGNSKENSKQHGRLGCIIGVVIVAVSMVTILIGVSIYYKRKRKNIAQNKIV